ncbi:hypothetical protein [Parashewanella tropica]|uniref:hypothetical protein n=1 Tax=Parashewanella tropica TaxID=2547970 RepID=UPI00105941B3|nr:hypothetical protein [Parashewanella tropica]
MAIGASKVSPRLCSLNTPIRKLPRVVFENGTSLAERAEGGIGGIMTIPITGVLKLEIEEEDLFFDYVVTFVGKKIVSIHPDDPRLRALESIQNFCYRIVPFTPKATTSDLLKRYIVKRLAAQKEFDVELKWADPESEHMINVDVEIASEVTEGEIGDLVDYKEAVKETILDSSMSIKEPIPIEYNDSEE